MASKPPFNGPFPLPTPPGSVSDADADADTDSESERDPLTSRSLHGAPFPPLSGRKQNAPSRTRPARRPPPIWTLGPRNGPPSSGRPIPPPANPTGLTLTFSHTRSSTILDSEPFWLFLYFLFNLGLTLYNKLVLNHFPFPYTLTALHAFSGTIGSYLAMEFGYFAPAGLTARETLLLTAFSFLYTINIAVSNLSLQLVTVPFHQVVRASTPLFIIALSYVLLARSLSYIKLLSLVPVILGVAFATYGDYYFTPWGFTLTLFGTFLAALKTIATYHLQTRHSSATSLSPRGSGSRFSPSRALKLHPLHLLLRMLPLAFVQCAFYAYLSGELDRVRVYGATQMSRPNAVALAINGVMAFGLNVVSFTANSKVGPLSITVAANVKQVLTILLAVSIFHLDITPTNAVGIAFTLLGGAWYAALEYREKTKGMEMHLSGYTISR